MKLTREQNLNCKLSDKQIAEIQSKYEDGFSSRYLGRKYGVSKSAILYWVNPKVKQRQLEYKKANYINDPEFYKKYYKKYLERKKMLVGKKVWDSNYEWRKKNLEARRKYEREYAHKNYPRYKERIKQYNRKYYLLKSNQERNEKETA